MDESPGASKKDDLTKDDLEKNLEKVSGIVHRVTYHNPENGWTVLKVNPFNRPAEQITVTVHQTKVFAGATVDFFGNWTSHPKFGNQFKAIRVTEKRPATASALEKYLGSGLIEGVGPKTAQKIVKHFGSTTLEVFDGKIERLMEIRGIAEEKLKKISKAWVEHKEISNVMLFLQEYGISTLFAVKIYKNYGNRAIEVVKTNPYQLAKDIYGIGFFSADKVALSLGFQADGEERITAGIRHILAASRDEGHCYLTNGQVIEGVEELLQRPLSEKIQKALIKMEGDNELKVRVIVPDLGAKGGPHHPQKVYYSKSIFFDEHYVSKKIKEVAAQPVNVDLERVESWLQRYSQHFSVTLSEEQKKSIVSIVGHSFSILTGGPGCGKTTTTKALVKLLTSMGKQVILAAPTGRAAQRMGEVIGLPAKTIHRLLVWNPQGGGFKKNEENLLEGNFLVVDECSMLDISLSASLLKAVPKECQVLFIGDADQLPSVGAGNVLRDLIDSESLNCFKLTKIFRQAEESLIIRYAHQINKGEVPDIDSPIGSPDIWKGKEGKERKDCLFVDSEEATQEQAKFIARARQFLGNLVEKGESGIVQKTGRKGVERLERVSANEEGELSSERIEALERPDLIIPKKFEHVNFQKLVESEEMVEQLKSVIKKIHPLSSLHYGWTASDVIKRLYLETIPQHLGKDKEIQILSPMIRGSLGTHQLNINIQQTVNPWSEEKGQIKLGEKIFRPGDRVIQKRNNYDLGVFNGDIGQILEMNAIDMQMMVEFGLKGEKKTVLFEKENLGDLDLAYAITIHKSQGSEFDVVIIPVMTQHFKMLFRNLIYTGLTRAKTLAIFVGTRRAFTMAIRNVDARVRQTALKGLIQKN